MDQQSEEQLTNDKEFDSLSVEDVQEVVDSIQRVDLAPCIQFLSTGCTLLDLAIADRLPGGFGGGRVSHIFGEEAAAKTVLVMEALGSAQRQGGIGYFEDAELTFDFPRAKLFGIDLEKGWEFRNPTSIEELFDEHLGKEILKKRRVNSKPGAFVVDSLSALPSGSEQADKLDAKTYGTSRAKIISQAFRKYLVKLNEKNLSAIFVDQARDNVGDPYGPKETVSGGRALKFYASTRIKVEVAKKIQNSRGIPIGVVIRFVVEKNKIAPPFRSGKFRIIFDYGIDDVGTSLDWLRDVDVEQYKSLTKDEREKKDEQTRIYGFGDHQEKGLDAMIKFIEDNNLEEQLRNRVAEIWRWLHSTPQRREKKRWD